MPKVSATRTLHTAATHGGEAVAKVVGLTRRRGGWQFRKRVPGDLLSYFGKTEFIERHEAATWAAAAQWARARAVHYDALIEAVRRDRVRLSDLSDADIRVIAVKYFSALEGQSAGILEADRESAGIENEEELFGLLMSGPDDASVQQIAKAVARMANVHNEGSGAKFFHLAQQVYEACLEHHRRQSDRAARRPTLVRNDAFSNEKVLLGRSWQITVRRLPKYAGTGR